jgi:hypothetical protein
VRVNGTCLRNLSPERIRLAETAAAPVVQLRRLPAEAVDFLF